MDEKITNFAKHAITSRLPLGFKTLSSKTPKYSDSANKKLLATILLMEENTTINNKKKYKTIDDMYFI